MQVSAQSMCFRVHHQSSRYQLTRARYHLLYSCHKEGHQLLPSYMHVRPPSHDHVWIYALCVCVCVLCLILLAFLPAEARRHAP